MRTILLVLIIAMLVGACAPAEPTSDTGEAPDTTTPAASQPSQAQEGSEDIGPELSGDANEAFEELFSTRTSASWRVTYDMTSSIDEMPDLTMTQYLDGAERLRIDSAYEGIESRTYLVDGVLSVCTNDGDWMCLEMDAFEGAFSAQNEIETEFETGDYDITETDSRTIAGVRAQCFTYVVDGGEGEYCFSDDGVPLYVSVTSEDVSFAMTATDYSTDVPASTWELPAEPQEFPSFGDGEFDPSAYI